MEVVAAEIGQSTPPPGQEGGNQAHLAAGSEVALISPEFSNV